MTPDDRALLSVRHLSQQFGAVPALVDVTFSIEPGEVLGVVGQRGAGKSTLFGLLSGVYPPQSGEITVGGRSVTFRTVSQAQRLGIVAVHQSPQLVNEMDVVTNIFLGAELRRPRLRGLPQEQRMRHLARKFLADFDISPDLAQEDVGNLSDEQRQIVALGHALLRPSRLLLLDNALEALSYARQQRLLDRIRALADEGTAVILSSDDLKQVFAVTDHILVLYQGYQVALHRTSETTPREIVELIVGSNRQEQVTPVIWAFESYHAAQQQVEELRRTQAELRQSLEAQDSLNRQLIERLQNQLEALDRLNLALQEASRRLITEREAERKALARELHDQVIQDLLSYNYQLEEAENELGEATQSEALGRIREGIREVVGSLRHLCSDLRPPTIDNHGLSAAIRSLASQWSKQTGIQVDLEIDPALGRLPEPIELSVFRIVQEGLRNIRKHAVATRVSLCLERTPKASLVMRLADDGRGMEAPPDLASLTEQKHFGLVGISERVSLLDGTLQVRTAPEGGVALRIEIPSPYPSIQS
jgi:signal transduction histidine kinase